MYQSKHSLLCHAWKRQGLVRKHSAEQDIFEDNKKFTL